MSPNRQAPTSIDATASFAIARRTWFAIPKLGDMFMVDGMERPVPMGLLAAAGKPAEKLAAQPASSSTRCIAADGIPRRGWPTRIATASPPRSSIRRVGMLLCNHPDFDYKKACFDAYNLWIAEYCAAHPDRLIGMGQTAMRSVEEGDRRLAQNQGRSASRA